MKLAIEAQDGDGPHRDQRNNSQPLKLDAEK
jgi:hypothetical protein